MLMLNFRIQEGESVPKSAVLQTSTASSGYVEHLKLEGCQFELKTWIGSIWVKMQRILIKVKTSEKKKKAEEVEQKSPKETSIILIGPRCFCDLVGLRGWI